MTRVAFASEDGHVIVHDLASGTDLDLSDRGRSSAESGTEIVDNWPTWSPDGRRVAFVRFETAEGVVRRSAVWVVDADGRSSAEVHSSADASPIYLAWSPDGERLGVLVQLNNTLALRVVDTRSPQPAVTVAQGSPLYFAWCADSHNIIAHIGTRGVSAVTMRLVLIRLRAGTAAREGFAAPPAPGFRAPAWSIHQHAATIAYARGDEAEIVLQSGPDVPVRSVARTGPAPAFAWSPDGRILAFAARASPEPGPHLGLAVVAADGGAPRQLTDEPLLGFFWCPDGNRLISCAGEMSGRMIHVQSVAVVTGDTIDLGWLRPTRDFWFLLSHFDQYARSMQLVSADSARVILPAAHAKEWENGVVPTVRQVLARSIDGGDDIMVGRGRTASWAPAEP